MSKKHSRTDFGGRHKCTKMMRLPKPYEKGFLAGFDERTRLYANLHDTYTGILDDLGGEKNCSVVKQTLVEKFTWAAFMMQSLESRIALRMAKGKRADKLFGKWLFASKTLNTLAHRLGLERKKKMVSSSLSTYVGKKRKKDA